MFKFPKKYLIFIPLVCLIVFFYSYNLSQNSRFIWDESRALVDMHRIWQNKELTFVGPISEDNLEMFPSLSYYLYLPTTIITKFDPLGPVYMSILLSLLSWTLFTLLATRQLGVNIKSIFFSLVVGLSTPVLIAVRWAWNPNLVIFWFSLFVCSLYSAGPLYLFLGGITLGASLYHHYLSLVGVIPALILVPSIFLKSKNSWKKICSVYLGFIISMVPFILFELKNHFYLSSASFLAANNKSFLATNPAQYLERLEKSLTTFSGLFISNSAWPLTVFFFATIILVFISYHHDKLLRFSFYSLSLAFLLLGLVKEVYPHYLYSLVPLFFLFLFRFLHLSSSIWGKILVASLLFISLNQSLLQIRSFTWEGDITAIRTITKIILSDHSKNINVAALASPDPNTTGQRYRDMALIKGKTLDAKDQYPLSKVLYVVSASSNRATILSDPAWEINSFRNSKITNLWQVSNLPLYLYRIEK